MSHWRILGRSHFNPPPEDWREQLASRLGQRPRRVGGWVELALFGALACLDAAGEKHLPAPALLSLSSRLGPDTALRATLQDSESELPMPVGFLQSLPAQALPVLAQFLGWSGNARCLSSRDPVASLHLACLEAPRRGGLLLGWVDEAAGGTSTWLRAVADESMALDRPMPASPGLGSLLQPETAGFAFDPRGRLEVFAGQPQDICRPSVLTGG